MNPQDDLVDLPAVQNSQNTVAGQVAPPANSATAPTPVNPVVSDETATNQAYSNAEITLPGEAEHSDLIEKEWVERAKEIVAHTKEDPHEQQRALSQMKADYLKKRYNKDIKIAEG